MLQVLGILFWISISTQIPKSILKNVLYLSNSSFTDSQNVISSSPSLGFITNDNWNILNNHEINNRIFNIDLGIRNIILNFYFYPNT